MSRPFVFKEGSVAVQSFSATLAEIADRAPRVKKANSAEVARARVLEEARAEGYAAGFVSGEAAGQAAGYQAGFDQAYTEASNEHAETLRAFAADLQSVRERLQTSIEDWFAASERELEVIAVQIAEKLIAAQLQLDRSFVVATTKEALRELSEANQARIRVNPFDFVILSKAREELLAATAGLRGIEIVADDTILGGCIIETERGVTDATIETRLEILNGGLEEAA